MQTAAVSFYILSSYFHGYAEEILVNCQGNRYHRSGSNRSPKEHILEEIQFEPRFSINACLCEVMLNGIRK
jgi:hypothetical protein